MGLKRVGLRAVGALSFLGTMWITGLSAFAAVGTPDEIIIEEEMPPLANFDKGYSWWWILIVCIVGFACAEFFRRYKLKKNTEAVSETEKTEE